DRYYVGQTDNPEKRLSDHNAGISGYTSQAGDWIIVHLEEFPDRSAALRRELDIKRKKSRKYIEWIINSTKD
ncbi:MAG: hypothetical protein RL213_827, partial [Bacteroidota bacterium]